MTELLWMFSVILFILGFVLLIVGGNLLVNGAVALAQKFNISPLLIGLTIVGFGTSVPELIASLLAINQDVSDLAVGNVVGSNIANILLVLGLAACIHPIRVSNLSLHRDGKFLLLATFALCIASIFGKINFILGLAMCACLGYYIYYAYQTEKKQLEQAQLRHPAQHHRRRKIIWFDIIFIILGIGLIFWGAQILVDNAKLLAQKMGIPAEIIGLTLIAVGTSLPELATSVIASIKKQPDIAFGNIVGSNIYNALFILGFLALFNTVPVNSGVHMLWMTGATLLLLGIAYRKHALSRKTGMLFLGIYVAYLFFLSYVA